MNERPLKVAQLSPASRYPAIDGLRGISVLLVVASHLKMLPYPFVHRIGATLIDHWGRIGVTMFFSISGYLITALLLRERQADGGVSLKNFYLRRALRMLPALYLFLLGIVAMKLLGFGHPSKAALLASATFTFNYWSVWFTSSIEGYRALGHLWSLAVEEQFYLIWGPVLALMSLKNARRFAFGVVLASPLIRAVAYVLSPLHHGNGQLTHARLDAIMIGCLLAFAVDSERLRTYCKKACDYGAQWACLFFLLVVSPYLRTRFLGRYQFTVGYFLESCSTSMLLMWVTTGAARGAAARALSWRPLAYIGQISYGLYLWQMPFLCNEDPRITALLPWSIVLIFGIPMLSYHFVEKPFLRLKERFTTKRAPIVVPFEEERKAA